MTTGIEDIYELTPLQEGMLFHTLYAPESSVYNIQLDFSLEGSLNQGALEQAWRALVERHAPLRTAFVWERVAKQFQVVHRQTDLQIARHDWRGMSQKEQACAREAFLEEDRTRLFDLAKPPLMRLAVLVLDDRLHRLVWTFHHIVLEGWSAAILLGEVWKHYADLCAGRPPELPPVRPYVEYIRWLQRQDRALAETYWRETLKGFVAPTRLPIDRSTEDAPAEVKKVEHCNLTLSKEFTDTLKNLSRAQRVTLNTVVQGAWALLLSVYSGEPDVMFGAVVSGRPADLPGAESTVGLFVNTLPVRVAVKGDEPVMPWLRALQLSQATMRQYEYSSLMQVRSWSDLPGGRPLFHTVLGFENWLGDLPSGGVSPDLKIGALNIREGSDQPLALFVVTGNALSLTLMYDVERFERKAVERMLGHLHALLQGMVEHPEGVVSDIQVLTADEREQLLVRWNRTERPYPREVCVHEVFQGHAERAPDATAVEFGDTRLSYGDLNSRANRVAHYLRGLGVGPDVLVGLSMERSPSLLVAMLGILKAGGAYVPLDPEYPAERLAFMLHDTGAPVVITQSSLLEDLPDTGAKIVCLDRDWPVIESYSAENLDSGARPDNLAYVIYTSGSSGTPKGVQVTHRGINRLVCNSNYVEIGPDDRYTQVSVISFDAATLEIWGSLLNGARLVGVPREVSLSPTDFATFLHERGITITFLTTALFNQIAHEVPQAFQPLRYVMFGGEAADPDAVRAVLRQGAPQHLVNLYGPTEITVVGTSQTITELDGHATNVPIGRPIANTTAYVLDEQCRPVPIGVPGELYLGGDGLARGYLKRPELTASHFVGNPFSSQPGSRLYRTGDWVRHREDGTVEFVGRKDGQVKVRGFRIELGEIEAALNRLPQVRESVVLVREDEPGDKRVVAYVVGNGRAGEQIGDLRDALRQRLPDYMLPSAFIALDKIPLTPNWKVDRAALPMPVSVCSEHHHVAPGNELEMKLAEIWQEVLRHEKVGVDDNFFDLGGNSLLLTKVHGKFRPIYEGELRLVDLFRFPTIRSLARHLERKVVVDPAAHNSILERAKKQREAMNKRQQLVRG